MATRVLWYSEKADDPLRMRETLEKAEAYCEKNKIPFNQLVNMALRDHLNLSKVDVLAARAKLKDARDKARKEKAAAKRAEKKGAKGAKGKKGGKKGKKQAKPQAEAASEDAE